jgi:HEAT repeat protein
LAPPALVDSAAYALRDLDDPRAIEPLLRKYPAHPTVYFEILRHLQRNRSPHPLLVKLREDRDPEIRWQASYALAEATYQQAAP